MLLTALAPSYPLLLAAMFVVGLGCGCLDLILTPVVVSLYPDRKSVVLNWLHAFYSIGGIITILVCGYAIARGWGWRGVVAGFSLLPFVTGLGLSLSTLPPMVREEARRQKAGDLVKKPVFILLCLGLLLAGIPEIGINVWLPAYSELELKLPAWQANLGLILFTAAMAAGRLLNGWLSHRVNVRHLMLAGCLVNTVFYLTASLSPSPVFAWVSCIVIGLGVSCLWPGMLSLTSERFPRAGASVYAVLSAVANIGGILTPWGIGLGGDAFGLRPALAMVSVFPVLLIVLLSLLARSAPKPA
jgi:fucose permease